MISVGGLPFDLDAAVPLTTGEREIVAAFERLAVPLITQRRSTLRVVAEPPWDASARDIPRLMSPAHLGFEGDCVRVAHEAVTGEFDIVTRRGAYARSDASGAALRTMLRAACTASLPLERAIPLHACGVMDGDRAYVMFGESGAGKTTLSVVSRLPVISDEMVAVTVENRALFARATGFGEELDRAPAATQPVRIAALVQLAKARDFRVVNLQRREATAELLKVVLSPVNPMVWMAVLDVIGEILKAEIPIVRMWWSGDRSPIPDLRQALKNG